MLITNDLLDEQIKNWLKEDVGSFDLTSQIVVEPGVSSTFNLIAREPTIISGLDVARAIFYQVDHELEFKPLCSDKDQVKTGAKVAAISGALNLLQERTSLRYSCGLQIIPSLLEYGDYSEIGSLIAPRPAVWEMGDKDALIVGDGWDTKFKQRLERIYNAYGQRENLHYDHFDGGHRWNGDVAFPLFDQVLKGE